MANGFDFTLVAAPDEGPFNELQHLRMKAGILRRATGKPEQEAVNYYDELAYLSSLFTHSHLGSPALLILQTAGPGLVAAIGTWLATRAGRKVKIKVGDVEIEASNADEIKDLLAQAQAFKQANEPKRIHER